MAECERRVTWPNVIRTQPPAVVEIVLRLSEVEANILRAVLDKIGGSPSGPRGKMDDIRIALGDEGITGGGYTLEVRTTSFSGSYLRLEEGEDA
ncbi:hypothetical protein LCGC14_2755500, partial [marine sediment metagenome]